MNINNVIRTFASFLNESWDIVMPLLIEREYTTNESSKDDWLQVNWEILVERKILPINQYLQPYGNGADYYGASCRILDREGLPTHTLKVFVKDEAFNVLNNNKVNNNKSEPEFEFDRLVGVENEFYKNSPPFDYVLVVDDLGIESVFAIDDIVFVLMIND